jgi:pectate lyase
VLRDDGSIFNGEPVDLVAAFNEANPEKQLTTDIGWEPPYEYEAMSAAEVADRVRTNAGTGKL